MLAVTVVANVASFAVAVVVAAMHVSVFLCKMHPHKQPRMGGGGTVRKLTLREKEASKKGI